MGLDEAVIVQYGTDFFENFTLWQSQERKFRMPSRKDHEMITDSLERKYEKLGCNRHSRSVSSFGTDGGAEGHYDVPDFVGRELKSYSLPSTQVMEYLFSIFATADFISYYPRYLLIELAPMPDPGIRIAYADFAAKLIGFSLHLLEWNVNLYVGREIKKTEPHA